MANEVAALWVVISGIIGLVVGGLGAYFSLRSGALQKGKVAALESELNEAQEALADYKQQVFNQFSDTADKFRDLDASYHALHRQLAESSVALCGDQATPLLTAEQASEVLAAQPIEDAAADDSAAASDSTVEDDTTAADDSATTDESAAMSADSSDETDETDETDESDKIVQPSSDAAVSGDNDNIVITEPVQDRGEADPVADATTRDPDAEVASEETPVKREASSA